jgi:hypothetical protein
MAVEKCCNSVKKDRKKKKTEKCKKSGFVV